MGIKAVDLVKVHVVGLQTAQAIVDGVHDVLAGQTLLVRIVSHGIENLVAITSLSRDGPYSLSARPVISSLTPSE